MPESSLSVIDGEEGIGMIASCGGGMPAPNESWPVQTLAYGSIKWLVIRIENHSRSGVHQGVQPGENPPDGSCGLGGSAPMEGLPLPPALSLPRAEPTLAPQRRNIDSYKEEA